MVEEEEEEVEEVEKGIIPRWTQPDTSGQMILLDQH